MAKIAMCAYCNTAVLLLALNPADANYAPDGRSFLSLKDKLDRDSDYNCRCGATQAYYDDKGVAHVTDTCVVFGCDTDILVKSIREGAPREVRFYRIAIGTERTQIIK